MANAKTKKVLTGIQIGLAALVVAGIVWIAVKVIGYNQAQQVYREIETAYASQLVEGDPSSIGFDGLLEAYPNAVGWLKMDDVDISYPVMRGSDNDYYLDYDPADEFNLAGSIFMDYRNKSFDDLHVLLYGHNMMDESMFGPLDEYTSEQFYKDGADTFTLITPKASYHYKIFAVNIVDPTDDVYQTGYQNPTVFAGFVKQLKSNSMYDTGVEVSGSDHVVTLSTCSANDRLVVSAKRV